MASRSDNYLSLVSHQGAQPALLREYRLTRITSAVSRQTSRPFTTAMVSSNTTLRLIALVRPAHVCLRTPIVDAGPKDADLNAGSIVVRGGKVIGRGFNDNRSGFSGGALKTGKLADNVLHGSALQDLKTQLKRKHKEKDSLQSTSFTPYESQSNGSGMGGGPEANTPLTMQYENGINLHVTSADRCIVRR